MPGRNLPPLPYEGMKIRPPYELRFIAAQHASELVNLYHLAKVALCNDPERRGSRYHRMLWASGEFHKLHPEVTAMGAYKDLEGLLS